MPNWIEGSMRIRGKSKDVYRFLTNAFKPISELEKEEINIEKYEYSDGEGAYISIPDYFYLDGSRRAFSRLTRDIYIEDISSEKETTCTIKMRQAWAWFNEKFYKSLSDKYDVDIRLIGWEHGMGYKGEMLVIRGQDPLYTETKYDNWEWETECPYLGG